MDESSRPVRYRVIGIREDDIHVPLCVYVSLEAAANIATLAQLGGTFIKIVIESDEEDVRRAQL